MSALRLLSPLDPNFGWDGSRLLNGGCCEPAPPVASRLRGAYASVHTAGATARWVRDPIGINKLFWGPGEAGTVLAAARPRHLVLAGCGFATIRAIPAGVVIDLDLGSGVTRAETLEDPRRAARSRDSIETIGRRIREALDRYCAALAAAHPGAPVFVCLSGGVDSTGAAVLARAHFADVTAVSFDLDRDARLPSLDRQVAERVAADLGVPLLLVTVTEETLLEGLDIALVEGIDWRDFNVHAALVNVALARGIAEHCRAAGRAPRAGLVLTGDLPNEYLCDYSPEPYRGRTYYPLPRLSPAALQRALVGGLDTSHREVGPFRAWGLSAVQVYAPVVDHYLALPEPFLSDPARKNRLARLIFGDLIPDYVYARPKTRAQVGDPDAGRGVLAACVEHGIDDAWLRRRFAELHHVSDATDLGRFMRGGRYRSSIPTLERP